MGYFIWILFCVISGAIIGNEGFDDPMIGGTIGLAISLLGILIWWTMRVSALGTVIGDITGDAAETIADVLDD